MIPVRPSIVVGARFRERVIRMVQKICRPSPASDAGQEWRQPSGGILIRIQPQPILPPMPLVAMEMPALRPTFVKGRALIILLQDYRQVFVREEILLFAPHLPMPVIWELVIHQQGNVIIIQKNLGTFSKLEAV